MPKANQPTRSTGREFGDLDQYRKLLVLKEIIDVHLNTTADEGLVLEFDDGSTFEFGFSWCEGSFAFHPADK